MKRSIAVGLVALSQLALVGVAVAPQLSARVLGDSYLLEVQPLDPIDPFRGAYVDLDYPGLRTDGRSGRAIGTMDDGESGTVFVTLVQQGEVWVASDWTRERPGQAPYLTCSDRNWAIECGIESWFLPQDEAREMEAGLVDGAYAEVRIDSRGHAALVDVRETP